jgi:hypothetical protein
LDEWQNYLESEFLDDPVDAAKTDRKPILPPIGSWSTARPKESTLPDADNWIPSRPAFGAQPIILSAAVTAKAPQPPQPHVSVKINTITKESQECAQVEP